MTIDAKALWEEVKANQAKLRTCAGPHSFYGWPPVKPEIGKKYTCALCGGIMQSLDVSIYMKGVSHGRRAVGTYKRVVDARAEIARGNEEPADEILNEFTDELFREMTQEQKDEANAHVDAHHKDVWG